MRYWKLFMCLFVYFAFSSGGAAKTYVVATENINYQPMYNFGDRQGKNFVIALFELFEKHANIEFEYLPLPIKRLKLDSTLEEVDFIFPDNPNWKRAPKFDWEFSLPLVDTIGVTLVKPEIQNIRMRDFTGLSTVRGFTLREWKEAGEHYAIPIYYTSTEAEALNMALMGRVMGVSLDYNVARFIIERDKQQHALVVARYLPFSTPSFRLSSHKHPELIQKMNAFLVKNDKEIEALKDKYHIVEFLTQLIN